MNRNVYGYTLESRVEEISSVSHLETKIQLVISKYWLPRFHSPFDVRFLGKYTSFQFSDSLRTVCKNH